MNKKNLFMLIGAFLVGGLVVGAIAYGGGAVLQGRLVPGQNPLITPIKDSNCRVNACEVSNEMRDDHKQQQNDINYLSASLSAVESRLNMIDQTVTSIQTNDLINLSEQITDVNNRMLYLAIYTHNRFTVASGKFEQLGLTAIPDLEQVRTWFNW